MSSIRIKKLTDVLLFICIEIHNNTIEAPNSSSELKDGTTFRIRLGWTMIASLSLKVLNVNGG